MTAPVSPLPPTLAERFQVDKLLGEGGAGAVYRVIENGQTFALKVLLPHVLFDERMVQRFMLEGEIMKRFEHPNILRVHEIGKDQQFPYLLCEYVTGETLADMLDKNGAFAWPRAFEVVLAMLAGLEVAHAQDIVHRDIKPSNVLMTKDGIPKLADFGIAKADKLAAKKTTTGMVLGSPAYMAPEILRGKPANARSDIYSTAVMLFELVSGQLPFPSDDSAESMLIRLREPAPLLSTMVDNVPRPLDEVLSTALATDPVNRFPTVATFRMALAKTKDQLIQSRASLTPTVARKMPAGVPAPWKEEQPKRRTRPAPIGVRPPDEFPWRMMVGVAALLLVAVVVGARMGARFRGPQKAAVDGQKAVDLTLTPEDDVLMQELMVASEDGVRATRLAKVEQLDPEARARVLYQAWRTSTGKSREEIGARLRAQLHPLAVPVLVEAIGDQARGDDPRKEAAAQLEKLVKPGADRQPPAGCPDHSLLANRLCSILTRTKDGNEIEDVVRATIRTLGWLAYPGTSCVADFQRAASSVNWIGRLPGDEPHKVMRAALTAINTGPAQDALKTLPVEGDPRDLNKLSK